MRNKFKIILALTLSVLTLMSTTAFALVADDVPKEIVLEDNRNLTPKGNAELLDDVTDNEELQFITVTARDGNVFYFVIDHGAESENVYFLNMVDEADLNALIEAEEPEVPEEPEPEVQEPEPELVPIEDVEKDEGGSNIPLLLILLLVAGVGIGAYYYKVILPKKKLDDADDIEDFEFTEEESEDEDDDDDEELEADIEKADEAYSEEIK